MPFKYNVTLLIILILCLIADVIFRVAFGQNNLLNYAATMLCSFAIGIYMPEVVEEYINGKKN